MRRWACAAGPMAAAPLGAEVASVGAPQGLARVEGNHPTSAFAWDGKGAVIEVRQGQKPSGLEPGDPGPWVVGCAADPFRASDWRGPLEATMGAEACREAQEVGDLCSPMERPGDRVVGTATGTREDAGLTRAVALGAWGALAVGVRRPDGSRGTWGGTSPERLAALAGAG